ncbi:hypothetical protein IQ241_00305 [Romeria aff. gracilis LEGE 07310]|uniref:Uncharacterized protein n=1 Tax=Vasconcelosia minhoensis LEGE 07310 TaxID=915328 RepID=A0A8J7DM12_9CYAN|nr:hypothetical protein [Romeria gracilis]MBE9075755.1 hypothetical protein [Romeria aff. gracilis LEGE 07310]
MIFEIQPLEHVGPIQLGMTPDEVRQILSSEFSTRSRSSVMLFRATPQQISNADAPERDVFGSLGLVAFYNESSICHAIKLFEPAEPVFQGVELLYKNSIESLIALLNSMHGECEVQNEAVVSYNLRIELGYWEKMTIKDSDSVMMLPPSEVVVFTKGYRYDW